jgi:hypothetical protein
MPPTQPPELQHKCPRYPEVAIKSCGTCKNISYCSPECQQADWATHKVLCKDFNAFTEPRPSPEMKRVVVFLPGEQKPRFMWSRVTDNELYPGAYLNDMYRPKNLFWRQAETSKNVWTGEDLGYIVQVWYDDNFFENFYDGGRAPALLAATQGHAETK